MADVIQVRVSKVTETNRPGLTFQRHVRKKRLSTPRTRPTGGCYRYLVGAKSGSPPAWGSGC